MNTLSGYENSSQKTRVIAGWNHGFRKVEFTKMLRNELGYSLSIAKSVTDEVLTQPRIELLVPDTDYERIAHLSVELGAIVIDEVKVESVDGICQ